MTLNVHIFSVCFLDAGLLKKSRNGGEKEKNEATKLTDRERHYAECLVDGFSPLDFFGYMTFVSACIIGMCHEYTDFVDLMDLKGRYKGMQQGGFDHFF